MIDPIDAIKNRKDLTYLDSLPDAVKELQPKTVIKPVPQRQPQVDKDTEALKRCPRLPPPAPAETQPATPAPAQNPILPTPAPAQQYQIETATGQPYRPEAPMGSQNPADQLRDAARNAARSPGFGQQNMGGGRLPMHPGAAPGGVEVLSDTQGVDFSAWIQRWHHETESTWIPIPDSNPPILKSGMVAIVSVLHWVARWMAARRLTAAPTYGA